MKRGLQCKSAGVMSSDLKHSFLLDKEYLDKFVSHISQIGQKKEPTSQFQLVKLQIEQSSLLVYQSGIVIFEHHPQFRKMISEFLIEYEIYDPDFQKYLDQYREEEEDTTNQGWETTPKGIWLTNSQQDAIVEELSKMVEVDQSETEKHELFRFVRGEEILVINKSGVVYTIGGFENFSNLVESAIQLNDPYRGYERVIAIDEQGRWNRIGPVGIAVVILSPDQIANLQLQGVKDSSLSRSLDYEGFSVILEDTSSSILLLEPQHINSQVSTKEDYNIFLLDRYETFLSSLSLDIDETTLVVVDKSLHKIVDLERIPQLKTISRNNRNSIALGIASMVIELEMENWRVKVQRQMGAFPRRLSLDDLKTMEHGDMIVKKILMP